MLYPKEDPERRALMFACRTCQFSEPAQSSCVFVNRLNNTVGETAGVTQDVGSDPTVGLPDFCTLCGECICCYICGSAECAAFLRGLELKGEHKGGDNAEVKKADVEVAEYFIISESLANTVYDTSATKIERRMS